MWNWACLIMFLSGVVSEVIVIYLLLEFSRPVSLAREVKEDDSDYEEEFDRIRDPNADMMYFVKTAPKMKRIKDVDYDIDNDKSAAQVLFEDKDAPSVYMCNETEFEDAEIDKLTDRMSVQWGGIEESQLRMAVFVAFVDNKDTVNLRKKTKKNRKEVVRRASMIGSVNDASDPEALAISQRLGKSARRMSRYKEDLLKSPQNQATGN